MTLAAPLPAGPTYEARWTTVLTDVDDVSVANPTFGEVTDLAGPGAARPDTFGLVAASRGSWGGQVQVAVGYRSAGRAVVDHAAMTVAGTAVPVTTTAGFYPNAWVEVTFGTGVSEKVYRRVEQVVGTSLVLADRRRRHAPGTASVRVASSSPCPHSGTVARSGAGSKRRSAVVTPVPFSRIVSEPVPSRSLIAGRSVASICPIGTRGSHCSGYSHVSPRSANSVRPLTPGD